MSEWYEPKEEDIDVITDGREEVHVFVKQNDFGAVYISLTFDQIKKIYEEVTAE